MEATKSICPSCHEYTKDSGSPPPDPLGSIINSILPFHPCVNHHPSPIHLGCFLKWDFKSRNCMLCRATTSETFTKTQLITFAILGVYPGETQEDRWVRIQYDFPNLNRIEVEKEAATEEDFLPEQKKCSVFYTHWVLPNEELILDYNETFDRIEKTLTHQQLGSKKRSSVCQTLFCHLCFPYKVIGRFLVTCYEAYVYKQRQRLMINENPGF